MAPVIQDGGSSDFQIPGIESMTQERLIASSRSSKRPIQRLGGPTCAEAGWTFRVCGQEIVCLMSGAAPGSSPGT